MKRLVLLIIASFCINSCCRVDKRSILTYSELQDSLEYYVRNSQPIEFPEDVPTLYYVIFYDDMTLGEDTIAIIMNGTYSYRHSQSYNVIGAGDVDGNICEILYHGFEHLPGIVNEDNLTLSLDDYGKYGYDEKIFDKPQYEDWYFTSGVHKRMERRFYRIHRPKPLERIK